jgi:DNA-directed RNA polymerase subunit RPC12/RpoP
MKYRPVTPELDAEIPRTFTCKVCSKPYTLDNYYDAYLTDIGTADHDRICSDCLKKTHVLKCSYCGKNVPLKVKDYLRNRNKQNYLCSDCRKEVTLTCSGCGKQFQDIFRYKDVRDKKGKGYFCQECRNNWRKS